MFKKKRNLRTTNKKKTVYGRFFVYALIDPINKEIFYVGRSKNPESRVKQHVAESTLPTVDLWGFYEAGDTAKHKRIKSIKNANLLPEIKILDEWEVASVRDANRLEDAWIAEMRNRGHLLTNFSMSRRQDPIWYRRGKSKSPKSFIKKIKTGEIQPVGDWIMTPEGKRFFKAKNISRKKTTSPFFSLQNMLSILENGR